MGDIPSQDDDDADFENLSGKKKSYFVDSLNKITFLATFLNIDNRTANSLEPRHENVSNVEKNVKGYSNTTIAKCNKLTENILVKNSFDKSSNFNYISDNILCCKDSIFDERSYKKFIESLKFKESEKKTCDKTSSAVVLSQVFEPKKRMSFSGDNEFNHVKSDQAVNKKKSENKVKNASLCKNHEFSNAGFKIQRRIQKFDKNRSVKKITINSNKNPRYQESKYENNMNHRTRRAETVAAAKNRSKESVVGPNNDKNLSKASSADKEITINPNKNTRSQESNYENNINHRSQYEETVAVAKNRTKESNDKNLYKVSSRVQREEKKDNRLSQYSSVYDNKKHQSKSCDLSRKNGNENRLKCTYCNKIFFSEQTLAEHLLAHNEKKLKSTEKKKKKFQCPTCRKKFQYKHVLHRHELLHNKIKPFVCKTCKEGFKRSDALKVHQIKIHTEIKPFTCDTCTKSFYYSHTLRKHQEKMHKKVKKKTKIR